VLTGPFVQPCRCCLEQRAQTMLERTLDDSANRRLILAEVSWHLMKCFVWLGASVPVYASMLQQ